MVSIELVSTIRRWDLIVRRALSRLVRWWLGEWLKLLPDRFANHVFGRRGITLSLAVEADDIVLDMEDDGRRLVASERISRSVYSRSTIEHFRRIHKRDAKNVQYQVRLADNCFFCRRLVLPVEAKGTIGELVTRDLWKKTPFKPEEVFVDYAASDHLDGGKIDVRQWVVRRKFVHDALAELQIEHSEISSVVGSHASVAGRTPIVRLSKRERGKKTSVQKAIYVLSCSAILFALVNGGLTYWRQQKTIDKLKVDIAAARVEARKLRARFERVRQVQGEISDLRRRRSAAPGLIDLWDEVTKLMPLHSWITEFRMVESDGDRGRSIAISGFSAAAPSLVRIIDGSTMFKDAALTAPVMHDQLEGRERFALEASVKNVDWVRK